MILNRNLLQNPLCIKGINTPSSKLYLNQRSPVPSRIHLNGCLLLCFPKALLVSPNLLPYYATSFVYNQRCARLFSQFLRLGCGAPQGDSNFSKVRISHDFLNRFHFFLLHPPELAFPPSCRKAPRYQPDSCRPLGSFSILFHSVSE